jgi:hypothetical protein
MPIVTTGEITIIDVNDGLNVRLSLENCVVPTNTDGTGGDYSLATTTISVWLGQTNDTANWSVQAFPSVGLTGTLSGKTYTVSDLVTDAGVVDFVLSKQGQEPVTARFLVTKARRGQRGPTISLIASAAGFVFEDNVATPVDQVIGLTLVRGEGVEGKAFFYASNGTQLATDEGLYDPNFYMFGWGQPAVGDTCYVTLANFGQTDPQIYVTGTVGNLSAVATISRINFSTAERGATRNRFRGPWQTARAYAIGDTVLFDGNGYAAKQDHLSELSNQPPSDPTASHPFWEAALLRGERGTMQVAIPVAGTTWSDATADSAIVTAGGVQPIRGDIVTQYNSSQNWSQTRVRLQNGTWSVLAAFFGGDVLVEGTIAARHIAANSITGDRLTANSVAADRLVANSITAGQIAAGAISSAAIQAGAVLASKIAIGDPANLYPDFDMRDPAFYASADAATFSFVANNSSSDLGNNWVEIAQNAADRSVQSGWFPVESLKDYRASAVASVSTSGSGIVQVFLDLASIDGSGNPALSRSVLVAQRSGVVSTVAISVELQTFATERRARFRVVRVGGSGVAARGGGFKLQKRLTGELIVDGVITTDKLAANSVTADRLAANSITARHISIRPSSNLLYNGGFDLGIGTPDDTNTYTAGGFAVQFMDADSTVNGGPFPARRGKALRVQGAGSVGFDAVITCGDFAALPGERFIAECWVRRGATALPSNNFRLSVLWYDSAGTYLSASAVDTSNSTWTTSYQSLLLMAMAPANAAFGRLAIRPMTTTGTVTGTWIIDDVVVRTATDGSLIVDGTISARHIQAGSLNADDIQAGKMSAAHLDVSSRLNIDAANAGLSLGKASPSDEADGIYFGRGEGSTPGFAFVAGRTNSANNRRQELSIQPSTGLLLRNARHEVSAEIAVAPINITTSQTVNLTGGTGKTLTLRMSGAGGGGSHVTVDGWGNSVVQPGGTGGATTVQFRSGTTVLQTWTLAGGLGGHAAGATWTQRVGQSGPMGNGGAAGSVEHWDNGNNSGVTTTAGGNGQGFGSGGGSSPDASARGGMAGQYAELISFSLDGIASPNLVITIGAGGVGAGSNPNKGGNGANGVCQYSVREISTVLADVIPIRPTATGTFTATASVTGNTIFPDLGPGMWILYTPTNVNLDVGLVQVTATGAQVNMAIGQHISFFADIRPNIITATATTRTVNYLFYSMTQWG